MKKFLCFLTISIGVSTVVVALVWHLPQGKFEIASIAVLTFTACAIVWYTVETTRLANVTERQLKIALQPIVVGTQSMPEPRLLNIGKSPAFRVSVEDIRRGDYTFKFIEHELCLVREESYPLPMKVYKGSKEIIGSGEVDSIKGSVLSPKDEDDAYELVIRYRDIVEGKWVTFCKVVPNGIRFERIEGIER